MSFFQNLFMQEFRGNWVLGDRQYSVTFAIPANGQQGAAQSNFLYAWNLEPYDLSAGGVLTINYAWDIDFKNWSALAIDVTGVVPAATTAAEIVNILNANATFADMFTASYSNNTYAVPPWNVRIGAKSGRAKPEIKVYISNTGAETKLGFNKKAPVRELPTYFTRHTIANRFNYPDSLGALILLDPASPTDAAIITAAGFNPASPTPDWQLLAGRGSGLFNFQNITVDGSNRITQIIEYPAGAVAGAFARKIQYVYTGANTNPSQITEIPYTLTSADLVTPP